MDYLTQLEVEQLKKCQTVADMFNFIKENFDLNKTLSPVTKSYFVAGLSAGMNELKPVRRSQRIRPRVRKAL